MDVANQRRSNEHNINELLYDPLIERVRDNGKKIRTLRKVCGVSRSVSAGFGSSQWHLLPKDFLSHVKKTSPVSLEEDVTFFE